MKRLWMAAALLAVLLSGTLIHADRIQTLADGLNSHLARAQIQAQAGEWEAASVLTRTAYEGWQDHHTSLHIFQDHGDTDGILRGFQAVLQYLELREMDQYAAANADLMAQIRLLAEQEQASLVNVL